MSIKFTEISKIIVMATIASLFSIEARANETSLAEVFEAAYFKNGENAIEQSSFLGQFNTILGIPKFPEQDITADMKEINQVYELSLERQTSTGERLITKDLDNPYTTSLREIPSFDPF